MYFLGNFSNLFCPWRIFSSIYFLYQVNIWGSSDLNYLVDAMRSFIPNAAVVHAHSFGEKIKDETKLKSSEFDKFRDPITIIDDEVVRISAITLNPSNSNGMTCLGIQYLVSLV